MTATVKGIALAPGVSKNNRLYTRENIAKAHARLAARLADPNGSPVVMRTHHAAGDDSTRIVGQITKATLTPDGAIAYEAQMADTDHAKTIHALAKAKESGKPALAHVSIYGWWMNDPAKVTLDDGTTVETADDLEINAVDFTSSPGVTGATVRAESHHGHAIHESTDAEITVTETSQATIETQSVHADPGYLNGGKRWPINTAAETIAAWQAINTTREGYTPGQAKRIRTRIKTAAKKHGVTIEDNWLRSTSQLTETVIGEYFGDCYPDGQPASFCITATNGPIRAEISSWLIDPADLEVVMSKVTAAITTALQSLDPDMDGDIDLPGAPDEDTDSDTGESAPSTSAAVAENAATEAETPTEKEPLVADELNTTAPVTEAAPTAAVIDYKALAEAFLAAQAAADEAKTAATAAAAAKETEEKTAPVTETADTATANDPAQLREAMKDVVRELLTESGAVKATRKGYALTETAEAETDSAELWARRGELFIAAARENARGY